MANQSSYNRFINERQVCPMCRGSGKIETFPYAPKKPCPRCQGNGKTPY
jgi:DnaJ-class molecular chaperone